MERRRRVILHGDSLVLAGVGASLAKYPGLEVVSVDAAAPLSSAQLAELNPDALLLDLGAVSLETALALARGRPELLLIGLDPAGERLLVLSGQQARALTTDDLVGLIENGGRLTVGANGHGPVGPEALPDRLTA
jgi:hypothetical protein